MAAIFKAAEDIKSREHFDYMLKHYCPNEEKVEHELFTGINTLDDPDMAFEDMLMVKKRYGKDGDVNKDGSINRFAKHYVASFDYDDSKKLSGELIHKLNVELINRLYEKEKDLLKGYQIFIATHEHGKDNVHSHIIINSVNVDTGKKINLPRSFLSRCKKEMNELLLENDLSIAKKNINKKSIYDKGLYNAIKNGNMTKQEAFAIKINEIAKKTSNKYLFIKQLINNGYQIRWVDDDLSIGKVGKIYITDKKTGEHHRLETLYKKFNFNFENNIDLKKHFELIENINSEKRKVYEDVKLSITNKNILNKEKTINKLSNDLKDALSDFKLYDTKSGIYVDDLYKKINYLFYRDKSFSEKFEMLTNKIKAFDSIKLEVDNIYSKFINENYIKNNIELTKSDIERIKYFINEDINTLIKKEIIKNYLKNENKKEHIANTRSFLLELAKTIKNQNEQYNKTNYSLEEEEERRKKQLQKEIEDALSY